MPSEINVNEKLAELLNAHGVKNNFTEEYVIADLRREVKFKARATYKDIGQHINSQLEVAVVSDSGEKIIEYFGDLGEDVDDALARNLRNFASGSLHVLLAALGSDDPSILDQITIEEWEVNGSWWTAYIGNLTPKTNNPNLLTPPDEFFGSLETGIKSQKLTDNLHWFRGYYLQFNDKIAAGEFCMDNVDIIASNPIFSSIPLIPDTQYYSCRNFIVLKRLN